jgi:catechol 2,3-dioxygenase-like lactoylglutathione lyase family enzyme
MITSGLIEVIVYVADMDAQVKFYRDTFGFAMVKTRKGISFR